MKRELIKSLDQALQGLQVGISGAIPEFTELRKMGGSELDIHFAVKRLTERVLTAGGSIVYGSHPTFTPIIESVALQILESNNVNPNNSQPKRVQTFASRIFFTDEARELFRSRHSTYSEVVFTESHYSDRDYALTEMRTQMIKSTNTLICIGGKHHYNDGHRPGVDEEADLAIAKGIPVFLVGCCGGYTRTLFEKEFSTTEALSKLNNRLDETENLALTNTESIWEAVDLVMRGLSRLQQGRTG